MTEPSLKALKLRAWKQRNPGRSAELKARWRRKPGNAEKHRAEVKAYKAQHPEKVAAQKAATRHARRAAGGEPISAVVIDRLLSGRICYYCGIGVSRYAPQYHTAKATVDHVVPLKYGGTNNEDNLVTACFTCNIRKRAMSVARFLDHLVRGLA